ncbi:hypothetical protein C2E25_15455 [Geothermobacter hydrogeniphilus]|uniref:Integrase n=1 Tax=Geothermobacter hydrogeniphilus TaxID=1969733 RepID=A0A2K2H681_9BACT|nr:DUF3596 domain-containing protein [Geothermobacter hydrogeniphilus]PNU18834.1 hypothetical protein C2E25_15455 [Geothermobacter hydrogeniphilus]
MGSLRQRNGLLFFDFRYQGVRCREQTTLPDTPGNRRKLEPILARIEQSIKLGTFKYADFFPGSPRVEVFRDDPAVDKRRTVLGNSPAGQQGREIPNFKTFALTWYEENEIRWRRSYRKMMLRTMEIHLYPRFGKYQINEIDRSMILKFRSWLGREQPDGKVLSPVRINHIMTPLKMILSEASERFGFPNPAVNIKALKVPRSDVHPFSLDEVKLFLANVRADFRDYYTVRFFTGLRTGEIDGLQWKYVDFDNRLILVRETIVDGVLDITKTPGSVREVWMSTPVFEALKNQFQATGKANRFVFCNRKGNPLRHRDITKRVWYPTLARLGLERRTPYQTRHTAATLWLGAGENPEWIARQMGHATTHMLFTVYSRFVPNLTRKDGSAFERLMISAMKGDDDATDSRAC